MTPKTVWSITSALGALSPVLCLVGYLALEEPTLASFGRTESAFAQPLASICGSPLALRLKLGVTGICKAYERKTHPRPLRTPQSSSAWKPFSGE